MRKPDVIKMLFEASNGFVGSVLKQAEATSIKEIHYIDQSGLIVKTPTKAASPTILEFLMSMHSYDLSFGPVSNYPDLAEESMTAGLDLNNPDIIYSCVASLSGHARTNAPFFAVEALLVIYNEHVEVYGRKESLQDISIISDSELEFVGRSFANAMGNRRQFSVHKIRSYCDKDFKLIRYDHLSKHNPPPSSTHTIDEWLDFAHATRATHESLTYGDDEYADLNEARWQWDNKGLLSCKGTIRAMYNGTTIDRDVVVKGDPIMDTLLSTDSIDREIKYAFDYFFEFNAMGRIQNLHLYRDVATMRGCYQMNSSDIDAILLSASRNATDRRNSAVANKVIDVSKSLYELEKKELAITNLFRAVDMASNGDRTLAVDAMGTAIYRMMCDNN